MREASSRPKREYKPKPRESYEFGESDQSNGGFSCNPSPKVSGKGGPGATEEPFEKKTGGNLMEATCQALLGRQASGQRVFPTKKDPFQLKNVVYVNTEDRIGKGL